MHRLFAKIKQNSDTIIVFAIFFHIPYRKFSPLPDFHMGCSPLPHLPSLSKLFNTEGTMGKKRGADSALLESQFRTFQSWGGNCHSHLACLQGAAKDALHVACLHLLGGHPMEEVAGVVVAIVKSEEGGCT